MQTGDELLDILPLDSRRFYHAGYILLSAYADLEEDIKQNYEHGTIQQKALARIAGLQGDLFSSYFVLLRQNALMGRSIILRSLIEHEGALLHIKGDDKRSTNYLLFSERIHRRIKNNFANTKPDKRSYKWTDSTIEQRISLFPDKKVQNVYDTLSDVVHGNNLQDFLDTEEITTAYIKAIDSYFVAVFINFMSELAVGLDINHAKRMGIFAAIEDANKVTK